MSGGLVVHGSVVLSEFETLQILWSNFMYHTVDAFADIEFVVMLLTAGVVSMSLCLNYIRHGGTNWQWVAFGIGFSHLFYLFLLDVAALFSLELHGFFQLTVYFGYNLVYNTYLGLCSGAAAYSATSLLLRVILSFGKEN